MSCTLSIKNLTCRYNGQAVLDNLSLEVERGEIVCLLGASGCGKTTLLKAIAGLLPLDAGKVSVNCRVLNDGKFSEPPEKRNIGMIFQDYALFPHLTVAENIMFGISKWEKNRAKEQVAKMLRLVHLEAFAERYPHQLSGGQQQRVAIARALACEPELLLLDEPFSNIDTQVRQELIREIRKIFKSQGVTAIFVTHSREEAFAFSDKLAVMNDGVIEQFGTAPELYYKPSSRFVADFLGAGSYVPVTRSGDDRLSSPLGEWAAPLGGANDALWLLRPQNLAISASPDGDGVIDEMQFMGDACRYVVDVNNCKLVVYSNLILAVGDRVVVSVIKHDPVLFETA
ncbi:ABC transporter ATP-binding protein [Parasalinivibrio latis]|uniref:ABC transporter ATP-binding protein n=1 Tax=Parasalinivibrio latis TaxID=2952610 RepID=UPI0030E2A11C